MVGGDSNYSSVSVWTTQDIQCSLPSLPRKMLFPSLDYWQTKIVACYADSCDELIHHQGWSHFKPTLDYRLGCITPPLYTPGEATPAL